jgi:hypothetical protein
MIKRKKFLIIMLSCIISFQSVIQPDTYLFQKQEISVEASQDNLIPPAPTNLNAMSEAEQWAANQKFLDRAIAKGTEFNLATPLDKVRPGSYLEKEIKYLTSQGYKLSNNGTKLVK